MTTQPLRRSLSHSQIESFAACPRKWYHQKLDKVPQAFSDALVLGSAVHAAIEADGVKIAAGLPRLPLNALTMTFRQALNAEIAKADPFRGDLLRQVSPAQRTSMRIRGDVMLAAYVREIQPHYHPLATEAPFEHAIPDSDWQFTGRIDARTVNSRDGAGVIVDLKTSKSAWRTGEEHHKDQASAYLWAAREAGWQPPVKRVVFVVFTGDAVSLRPTERTPGAIDAYVAGVRQTAREIETAVEYDAFSATPAAQMFGAPGRQRSQCCWCGCWGVCQPGREWMRSHGETPVTRGLDRDGKEVVWGREAS